MNTCETCKFWDRRIGDFGLCNHPNTYSWVRGQSFEPPKYFGCINWFGKLNQFAGLSYDMKEYRIVNGQNRDVVETRVTELRKNGWELQGGISVSQSPSGTVFAQALKREQFKRDENE